jgi:hypothetical protein
MSKEIEDITFHYTNEEMVKDLIRFVPFKEADTVLDAGSGKNKVWYNNLPENVCKYECELEDGIDFLTQWHMNVDWVVGNPPFHLGWKFTEKAFKTANKGVAFLLNNAGLNSTFTPKRMQETEEMGWYLQHIRVVADKRWFGRYYFLIFTREPNKFMSCHRKTY